MTCDHVTANMQCLYQATSGALGFQCAGEGVVNDLVTLNFDKRENYYLESLAEWVQEASFGENRPGAHPAPYFVCEQYCSNDVTCLGFVPDFEYGQDDYHGFAYSFHHEDEHEHEEEDVEFEEVRCVIARGASPTNVTAIVENQDIALDVMAQCYTKNSDLCISPLELDKSNGSKDTNTTTTTDDMCSACSSMTSTTGNELCFWCEPSGFFNWFGGLSAENRPVGKCVCTSDLILGSDTVLNAETKEHICITVSESWSGATPISASFVAATSDSNTTDTNTAMKFSCAASLETLRMEDEQMAAETKKLAPFFFLVDLLFIAGLCTFVWLLVKKCCMQKSTTDHDATALATTSTDIDDTTVATSKEYESDQIVMACPVVLGKEKEVQTGVPAIV